MLENIQKQYPTPPGALAGDQKRPAIRAQFALPLCALGLLACVLLAVTPLVRVPDTVIRLRLAAGSWLAEASAWLPLQLGALSQANSAALEFFGLTLLAFLCYGLGALLVHRQANEAEQGRVRALIWFTALLAGIIFVVTPAMLSHDILVYASYSRVLAVYHANPYFVPIAAFPHDPFVPINYWANVVSAYGPIWMLVCAGFGWLLSPDPATYVVAFRLFALASHLLNAWLVGRTLRALGRSPRTVTLGMLLYAWNPLLLLESGLGGHNDSFMITFVLLGVLLSAHAERQGTLLRPRGYLPAIVAFTLAVLVKFTTLPVLAAYLLFLVCKVLRSSHEGAFEAKLALRNWRSALLVLLWSGLAAGVVALAFYAPFWMGHTLRAIMASFQSPPSALGAENSFMRSVIEWLHHHPEQTQNRLLQLLSTRRFWDDLNFAAIAACLILGALLLWRRPTTRTFALVSLLIFCVVLLITPWFYSWYIVWPLSLAVLCLPVRQSRAGTTLLTLTLTFSVSALFTYLFTLGLFGSHYYLVSLFTTIPPACAFLLALILWQRRGKHTTGEHL